MNISIFNKILQLKKEKNAIILAHYYQRPEIQEIADFVGDSYYLSKVARDCSEDIVVFCGVKFMAESAKIMSPQKTILLPAIDAGCPMADMAEAEEVQKMKEDHPNAAVVAYINSSTEVKALCDVCVTSSSAEKIISKIENDEILFLPDKNLGGYIAEKFPDKKFILWDGFCITHAKVNKDSIIELKNILEDVQVLVHPECEKEIRDIADYIGSTSGIIERATVSENKSYVVVTEKGILHELKKKNPHKNFYTPGATMTCMNMKKTTLEDVYASLLNMKHAIEIDEKMRLKALNALVNMHNMAK
ncbi:quinolinate synthetase [Peptoclostridium litorale DSM 5388]|uniref:Quinolinate synthase n=1 Tax=Peptoclostridium litorale DSM 5388 TaxID=1121324 RepID=A0A069RIU1_PEPLI|nr:quinolinate synthase NadA [Peptoclostridium litorale]KDR96708.1 quinolinate synthase A [Peptoclostridium litorale DSM 5388]SIN67538.1 quinolinate synthetase [Peptoclostridium litorale DSM 5388]